MPIETWRNGGGLVGKLQANDGKYTRKVCERTRFDICMEVIGAVSRTYAGNVQRELQLTIEVLSNSERRDAGKTH